MLFKLSGFTGIIVILVLGFGLFSATVVYGEDLLSMKATAQPAGQAIFQADRDFAKMAADSGVARAFVFFAADSATMLRRGSKPIVGHDSIKALFSDETGTTLKWDPYFADIAASGDLGYTLGKSQYIYKDSTGAEQVSYGYYVTIWKKQPDGSWKYVLDTGVSAPPPDKKP